MIRNWLNARDATEIGIALADQYVGSSTSVKKKAHTNQLAVMQEILRRADHEVRPVRLNLYKKAKFANSFKWRLLEKGIDKKIADEVTQALVMHLSRSETSTAPDHGPNGSSPNQPASRNARQLLVRGNKLNTLGKYAEAVACYEEVVAMDNPRHATALNNLGAALCNLGRYTEAKTRFRQAIRIDQNLPDAHSNLGNLLRLQGNFVDAEKLLRYALKLNPRFVDARVNLGLTLALLNRLNDANSHFQRVVKIEPRNADALYGLALVARFEGRFDEAGAMLERTLKIRPNMPSALSSIAGIRKMTPADAAWLERAEEIAGSGIAPMDESELRFAIGKYYDDVEDFEQAFQSYERGNDLLKPLAGNYDRDARTRFVDELTRFRTQMTVDHLQNGSSDSMKPVFVVGMPRSGTSLVEQIVASHPSAKGAGELEFWNDAIREHGAALHQSELDQPTRRKLADSYLRSLEVRSGDAIRVVDKMPANSDHLGIIHSVFPRARIIYVQRDPIDACLSCYFQKFTAALTYTMDLSDLAHYYREHCRLMAHWRAVLPPGSILDVPYAELVADQEAWSRKIVAFLGLEWQEQCLHFHKTKRSAVTASFWQVRQKIFKNSVGRWRNYQRFIKPLLSLSELDSSAH
jgi:tetratricopeptide (TPR) repeat protein